MSRTYLVVPGDDPESMAKALSQGADAVVVDLVGGGPDPVAARASAAAFASSESGGTEVWLRINPGPVGHDDIREVVAARASLSGLFVGRAESPVQLDALDSVLSIVEAEAGRPARSLSVVPSLESAGAVLAAAAIARAPRVTQLFLAEEEIAGELGLAPSEDEHELLWLRSHVVFASAAAGLAAPIACAWPGAGNVATLGASTRELRRLGFAARACATPDQVALVDEVFRPSADELAAARDVLERWAASRDTSATCHDAGGRAIDEARVRQAHRTLRRS